MDSLMEAAAKNCRQDSQHTVGMASAGAGTVHGSRTCMGSVAAYKPNSLAALRTDTSSAAAQADFADMRWSEGEEDMVPQRGAPVGTTDTSTAPSCSDGNAIFGQSRRRKKSRRCDREEMCLLWAEAWHWR